MTSIKALYDRFQKLNTDTVAVDAMQQTSEVLANINVEQMNKGLRSDGSEMAPSYKSDEYAEMKNRMNPLPGLGVPDLRLTGAYQEGVYVNVDDNGKMTFGSSDEKALKLEKKYSKKNGNIYGLSAPFKREYMDNSLRPAFAKGMQAATGLKMK